VRLFKEYSHNLRFKDFNSTFVKNYKWDFIQRKFNLKLFEKGYSTLNSIFVFDLIMSSWALTKPKLKYLFHIVCFTSYHPNSINSLSSRVYIVHTLSGFWSYRKHLCMRWIVVLGPTILVKGWMKGETINYSFVPKCQISKNSFFRQQN